MEFFCERKILKSKEVLTLSLCAKKFVGVLILFGFHLLKETGLSSDEKFSKDGVIPRPTS